MKIHISMHNVQTERGKKKQQVTQQTIEFTRIVIRLPSADDSQITWMCFFPDFVVVAAWNALAEQRAPNELH